METIYLNVTAKATWPSAVKLQHADGRLETVSAGAGQVVEIPPGARVIGYVPDMPATTVDLGEAKTGFDSIRFGPRDIAEAKTQSEAAQIILTNMFYDTFDDGRVWTNEEWRAAIREAAQSYPAFDAILVAEHIDWRNDDFADRVIAIRDAGGSMKD